jgi:hypothetical protein
MPMPIGLDRVLDELGITLVRDAIDAHGLLRLRLGRWQIAVRSDTSRLRQRFTVAHELGHYFIESRLDFRPTTSREYWMLEAECQAFAAALLAPRSAVEAAVAGVEDPAGLILATGRLAEAADVALEAAARRIVEHLATPTVMASIDLDSRRSRGSVRWLHASDRALSVNRGHRIRAHERLAPVLAAALGASPNDKAEIDFGSGPGVVLRQADASAFFVARPRQFAQPLAAAT